MKTRTAELLYLMLWTCGTLARPTFRNLTDTFESWAYRNGLQRQLDELERRKLVESQRSPSRGSTPLARAMRLTEAGRILALGGREPPAQWGRRWDGYW